MIAAAVMSTIAAGSAVFLRGLFFIAVPRIILIFHEAFPVTSGTAYIYKSDLLGKTDKENMNVITPYGVNTIDKIRNNGYTLFSGTRSQRINSEPCCAAIIDYTEDDGDIMKTKDLIKEATSLPVEERTLVVDSLLRSLNPPDSVIDKKWAEVAKRRLADFRSGSARPVPGEKVFENIWKRFS
jgi:putative addiction module component (TIGR02574 family)